MEERDPRQGVGLSHRKEVPGKGAGKSCPRAEGSHCQEVAQLWWEREWLPEARGKLMTIKILRPTTHNTQLDNAV